MRHILDSSVFISFFNDNDVLHEKTESFVHLLLENKKIEVILPAIVFLETANVLSKWNDKFNLKTLIDFFSDFELAEFDINLIKRLIPLFKEIHLKTSDATVVGITKLNNATLITWDKQLIKRSESQIIVISPDKYEETLAA